MFSIIIPTFNNLNYLKLCIESIKKNSEYDHELLFHINEGSDGSLEYIKEKKYKYSYSKNNQGVCVAFNEAAKLTNNNYIVLAHDDMYFCPGWDTAFYNEIKKISSKDFFYRAQWSKISALILNLTVEKHMKILMKKNF